MPPTRQQKTDAYQTLLNLIRTNDPSLATWLQTNKILAEAIINEAPKGFKGADAIAPLLQALNPPAGRAVNMATVKALLSVNGIVVNIQHKNQSALALLNASALSKRDQYELYLLITRIDKTLMGQLTFDLALMRADYQRTLAATKVMPTPAAEITITNAVLPPANVEQDDSVMDDISLGGSEKMNDSSFEKDCVFIDAPPGGTSLLTMKATAPAPDQTAGWSIASLLGFKPNATRPNHM